jgi:hypothetical protein
MVLPQTTFDKVEPQNYSVPLFMDPFGEGTKDWALLRYLYFDPCLVVALEQSSEVFVYGAPRHKSTTTSTDFEAHLTPGDETLSVEGDTFRGEFVGPRPTPSSTLSRIQARQPQILRRAMEIRQEYGDPIQNLATLLENMPGSQEDWEALIDEPYY